MSRRSPDITRASAAISGTRSSQTTRNKSAKVSTSQSMDINITKRSIKNTPQIRKNVNMYAKFTNECSGVRVHGHHPHRVTDQDIRRTDHLLWADVRQSAPEDRRIRMLMTTRRRILGGGKGKRTADERTIISNKKSLTLVTSSQL